VDEALAIAKQIADALHAAHDKGVIHRDLKPANVKIASSGAVKVLDFGLAKPLQEQQESASSDSPTLMSASVAGVILGTAAYMSPEQAKGRTADKRSDVWAFGALLYEMLTARRAFEGEDVSETLAAILKGNPDWNLLPHGLPSTIRTLIERCLSKDPHQRITDIGVVQFLLNEPAIPAPAQTRAKAIVTLSLFVVVITIANAAWLVTRRESAPVRSATRFSVVLPPGVSLTSGIGRPAIALSPDGNRLVYTARLGAGDSQLYSRTMDQLEGVPIRGTEGAANPFFSPDGQWIGFFSSDSKLKKMPVAGGAALTICEAFIGGGVTWLPDDSIIYRPGSSVGLWRVSAAGGMPQEFLKPDGKSEFQFWWPETLPGGKAIVFTIQRSGGDFSDAAIGLLRLDTGERLVLVEGATHPHYLSSGHLVFLRGAQILAVPFDLKTLKIKGTAAPIIEGVTTNIAQGSAQFTASPAGSVAYIPGSAIQDVRTFVWVDRHGKTQPVAAPKRNYEFPRLSPDGEQIAVRINGGSDPGTDIWLYQFARNTLSRFTSKLNDAETPVWTPDGKRVAYAVTGGNPARQIVWKLADGSGGEEVLAGSDRHLHLGGWSPKGDTLVAMATDAGNIWLLETMDKQKLSSFLQTPYQMRAATISPDAKWIAYASNDTNRFEVYVQPFPALGARYQVSTDGGTEPIWGKNGRELFYRNGEKMMAVSVGTKDDKLEAGTPTLLFEGRFAVSTASGGDAWYDVSPDGQRFLMLKTDDTPNSTASIVMIQDWAAELKRVAPPK
jgi:serine/threonine-protein kinase